jgi:hypothetical protein
MFGLSKREQRWAAEQRAAELLTSVATAAIQAAASVEAARANVDAAELERLRTENAELRDHVDALTWERDALARARDHLTAQAQLVRQDSASKYPSTAPQGNGNVAV